MAVFISIDDVWMSEGAPGATFTVRLSEASLSTVQLTWGLYSATAAYNSDFTGVRDQVLTFAPGETEQTFFVAFEDDDDIEGVEAFRVVFTDPVNGTLTRNAAWGIIGDNDTVTGAPRISVSDVVFDETGQGHVIVQLDSASTSTVTVDYSTASDSASAGLDFVARSGTLVFDPGEVVQTIEVEAIDDALPENTERLFFNLSNASGAVIAQSRATLTLADNDRGAISPFISVDDVWTSEGDDFATFTVSLSGRSAAAVSLIWDLYDLTSSYNGDYVGFRDQTILFAPGEVTKTIRVPLLDDDRIEQMKAFAVILSDAAGGTFAKAMGTGVIVDNDTLSPVPNITVDDAIVNEGGDAYVVVRLDAASASTVSVDYATGNGSAVVGGDYVAGSGTLTFLPGETVKSFRVAAVNDVTPENVEQFFVHLDNAVGGSIANPRGTITVVDNDAAMTVNPLISIDDVWINEGDAYARFAVTLSGPSASAVSVEWSTSANTAGANGDYRHLSRQTLTFAPGETVKTILVPIIQDDSEEAPESFRVTLSNSTNGSVGRTTGTAVIIDDDAAITTTPTISFVPATPRSVSESAGWIDVPVMLDQASIEVQHVTYATLAGTATNLDFVPISGTLAFLPGEVTKTVRVFLRDDLSFESPETLTLRFGAPGTPGFTPSGLPLATTLTITDNEVPIRGGTTDDSLLGRALPDQLLGLGGNDRLYGFGGDDTLVGGPGNDTLDGGTGNDLMIGGAGNDTYYFTDPGDRLVETAGGGIDTVVSPRDMVLSAAFENLVLTGSAAVGVGHAGNNTLVGNALANLLVGDEGNDVLDGRGGVDTLLGGNGNDTFIVDTVLDVIGDSSGVDTVRTTVSGYRLGGGLENLVLLGAALSGVGNSLSNTIYGNAGANVLSGLDGNDILAGGAGADAMYGGAGNDRYYVDNARDRTYEAAGQGTDIVYASVSHALASNVENGAITGSAAINLSGNGLGNALYGNGNANVLNGGAGADVMVGGAGSDTYVVDNSGDRVIEGASPGIDRVVSSIGITLATYVENATLTGTAIAAIGNGSNNQLIGNAAANTLYGLAGNDTLSGGAGADRMVGGLGNDTYYTDHAGDVIYEAAGQGTDTVNANRTYALAANIENASLLGTAALGLFGNTQSNVLTGNSAGNTIFGGSGNDTILGAAGNDRIAGNLGRDVLYGGAGNDVFVFTDAAVGAAARDIIQDFTRYEDRIDLSALDADLTTPGNQAFSFNYYYFSGDAGDLRFSRGLVEGDRNGDGYADFQIAVTDTSYLYASDFIL